MITVPVGYDSQRSICRRITDDRVSKENRTIAVDYSLETPCHEKFNCLPALIKVQKIVNEVPAGDRDEQVDSIVMPERI